jgi:hypothetical protein
MLGRLMGLGYTMNLLEDWYLQDRQAVQEGARQYNTRLTGQHVNT